MPTTTFIRLLAAGDKAATLAASTAALRAGSPAADTYAVDPASFRQIPGAPFAYWVSERVRGMFSAMPQFEYGTRVARRTNSTDDDTRYLRHVAEISQVSVGRRLRWVPLAKGGEFGRYYSDIHLLVDWDEREFTYSGFEGTANRPLKRPASADLFFRPGLTYPRRTQGGFNVRVMPAGCIFADKGPSIFVANDEPAKLFSLLAIVNSTPFRTLLSLQMAFGSYEVGVVQRTPVPNLAPEDEAALAALAREAHDLKRDADRDDEVTHPFTVPALVRLREHATLADAGAALRAEDDARAQRLAAIQREIDDRCFALYGFSDEDRAQAERGEQPTAAAATEAASADGEVTEADDEDEAAESGSTGGNGNPQRLPHATEDMLMYALGCAFGRWDVRIGRDPSLAPKLADPFAPLPVCVPGALVGPDGLPATKARIASEEWLRVRPDAITLPPAGRVHTPAITAETYPLPVAWDGILVDDADSQDDIVRRVRAALDRLWSERASAIEQEACAILGVRELRDYFRNPRAFFDHHIGRYSKSRRKAPIYWLLQSPRRHYAIWLYYHRLDADLLFKALTMHLLPKITREERRLEELVAAKQQAGASGSDARRAALAVERQQALLTDLREFRAALDRAAKLYLTPDLNDGVLLTIAPLWEVLPWKEAKTAWQQLTAGKYDWSSIGRQLREKGLVNAGKVVKVL